MRETPRAEAAYLEYAAMGPGRSLAKLHEQLGQSQGKAGVALSTLEAWSSAHNWQARVREHDAAVIAEKEAKRLAAIEAMNERQASIGTTQQRRALAEIERLLKARRFKSSDAIRLLHLAVSIERTARGAPTDVQRVEQTGKDGGPIEVDVTDARALLAAKLAAQHERSTARKGDSGSPA